MLEELRINNLGVIEEVSLVLPVGSIAVTGETGAGKTMVVGAIQLLMGARAEPEMVRVGATEAVIEGRFVDDSGEEVVARRVVPADGRSRAYLDGSLATATALQERIAPLIDLHGQHSQQSLLRPATQRHALDAFGGIETATLADLRATVRHLDSQLAQLGGDATERARQMDLLRYQLDELTAAGLSDPGEAELLDDRETTLAHAFETQAAAAAAIGLLASDGPAADAIGKASEQLSDGVGFDTAITRLQAIQEDLSDLARDLRRISEETVDDPEAREVVRARRQLLAELCRKYGPSLQEVIGYEQDLGAQLDELESHEQRVVALTDERSKAMAKTATESNRVRSAREKAAPKLAKAVVAELAQLAMANARVQVNVDGDAGDDVAILLAPNPGMPELPVGKGASGGELSRTMLALRLVIAGGPPIKIFDEVDAGIGGETANTVGSALAALESEQVFVVTHLAQVAARTQHHIRIDKSTAGGRTASAARVLDPEERIDEVARMLSGSPDSAAAIEHASELLSSNAAPVQRG